ncbi:MAG: hypothetical protein QXW55_01505 [Candidatus Bathyarchaeia archaeon]
MKVKVKAIIKLSGIIATMALSMLTLYRMPISDALLDKYEIIGVLLSAFFSHLTIIARGFFVPLFLSLTEKYSPLLLGLSAGFGGGLGEIIAYCWGSSIKETLSADKGGDDPLPKWIERYGLLAILLFASSPLPDTPIMILAGAFRFPLWKLTIIQVIGKTTLYTVGAVFGGFVFMELKSLAEEIFISTIILALSVILCILVSWGKSRRKILSFLDRSMRRIMHQ